MSDFIMLCILSLFSLFNLQELIDAAVDCGNPVYDIVTDQGCVEIDSVYPPPTTLEGGNYTIPCKSLLVRTAASIDYCPIGVCKPDGQWTVTSISCGSGECANGTSTNYQGRRNCTISGRSCQRWDSQIPHAHSYTNASFPFETISGAGSYCRDPDGDKGSPWCFTTDPAEEWETCNIPNCAHINDTQGTCTNNYCGDPESTTHTDNMCTSAMVASFDRSAGSTVKTFCNSLLQGVVSNMAYCPVLRCQPDSTWAGVFQIACGENECYNNATSDLYAGGRSCTENGWACQSWDVQSPHSHSYSLPGVGGKCRDPNKDRGEPWCYTTNPAVEWEFCDLPHCPDIVKNDGTCTITTASPITALPSTTPTISTSISTSPGTTSTTTVAPPFTGIPVPGQKYQLTTLDVNGYTLQYTVSNSVSRVRCGQHCSQHATCVMFTVESDNTCTLYEEDAINSDKIFCSSPTIKCYEEV